MSLTGTIFIPTIIPITDLRKDAAMVLRQVRESKEPIVITQRGRAAAVMMSAEVYERSEHDRELLRLLARGEKEIAAAGLIVRKRRYKSKGVMLISVSNRWERFTSKMSPSIM